MSRFACRLKVAALRGTPHHSSTYGVMFFGASELTGSNNCCETRAGTATIARIPYQSQSEGQLSSEYVKA
jgi:hypothetical protein